MVNRRLFKKAATLGVVMMAAVSMTVAGCGKREVTEEGAKVTLAQAELETNSKTNSGEDKTSGISKADEGNKDSGKSDNGNADNGNSGDNGNAGNGNSDNGNSDNGNTGADTPAGNTDTPDTPDTTPDTPDTTPDTPDTTPVTPDNTPAETDPTEPPTEAPTEAPTERKKIKKTKTLVYHGPDEYIGHHVEGAIVYRQVIEYEVWADTGEAVKPVTVLSIKEAGTDYDQLTNDREIWGKACLYWRLADGRATSNKIDYTRFKEDEVHHYGENWV